MSQDHLILISIGPVQEFIAAARKLRDLWFGSYMLSELSKGVARKLHAHDAELIFPAPKNFGNDLQEGSDLCVANKILARLGSDIDPATLAKVLKQEWQTQWRSYAEGALNEAQRIGKIRVDEELFWKQVKDLGEFYVVWTPVTEGNYKSARDRAETLLTSRKVLRDFSAPLWDGSGLFKSSLDGVRESVIIEKTSNRRDSVRIPEIKGLLKKNERLDAMGLIKRFYPMGEREERYFDDLSDIAILPWLDRIDAEKQNAAFEAFENAFTNEDDFTKSKQARRKSRLHAKLNSQAYFIEHLEGDENDQEKVEKLRELYKAIGNCPPNPYACILVGDGDKMGAVLDELTDVKHHQIFSQELSTFANEATAVVDDADGCLLYSGGDDVMAYLPLHTALAAADALRLKFEECMQRCKSKIEGSYDLPTFSIGMVLVHHVEPLSNALALARKAEKMAKNEGRRNALSIIQNKRSGGELAVHGKWTDSSGGIVRQFEGMLELYTQGHLSHTLPYQMREIHNQCGGLLHFEVRENKKLPQNATSALTKRLLLHKADDLDSDNKEHILVDSILPEKGSLRQLSDRLIIAKTLSQSIELSNLNQKD